MDCVKLFLVYDIKMMGLEHLLKYPGENEAKVESLTNDTPINDDHDSGVLLKILCSHTRLIGVIFIPVILITILLEYFISFSINYLVWWKCLNWFQIQILATFATNCCFFTFYLLSFCCYCPREQGQYKNPTNYSGWKRPPIEEVCETLCHSACDSGKNSDQIYLKEQETYAHALKICYYSYRFCQNLQLIFPKYIQGIALMKLN